MSGEKSAVSVSQREKVLMGAGRRLGRLVVRGLNRNGDVVAECDCGETVAVTKAVWLTGKRYQCGSCDEQDAVSDAERIVGCTDTYRTLVSRYRGIIDRCSNPNNQAWDDYGGRGIQNLYGDQDAYVLHMWSLGWRYGDPRTTDRIDVDGHYEPNNVRLAMPKEQVRNRRVSVVVDTGDEVISLADLAEQNGVQPNSSEYSRLSSFVAQSKRRAFEDIMGRIAELTSDKEVA